MFPSDHRLTIDASRAIWREIGDEIVVLDAATATYLSLNLSAVALWKRLDGGATPAELAVELVTVYDISPAQAESDVEGFLVALRDLSLLSSNG
jgi:Coenzyme PQQ synthesis protein D (PqqD)